MKRILYLNLLIIALLGAFLAWELWQNNKPVRYPQQAELNASLDEVAGWLEKNQSALIHIENPILFWMIKQAWENTGHEKLGNFYRAFKTRKLDPDPPGLWIRFFNEDHTTRVPPLDRLDSFRDYQLFLLYGLTCDSFMKDEPVIQKQLQPEFCENHFLHPRCISQQIMGLRLIQRYECGLDNVVEESIEALQEVVVDEMIWDFRVGDAYIQRVSMLVDSGAGARVKPIWIQRILEAQNDDGSWDDLYPIVSLPDDHVFGLTSTLPDMRSEITGNFHTTAQAVWLLSMLLRDHLYLAPNELTIQDTTD